MNNLFLATFSKILIIFALISCPVFAQEQSEKSTQKPARAKATKTRITSDFIDIKRKTQKIDFLGNVVVKNGPDMMTSQKMTVFYKEEDKNTPTTANGASNDNSIEKIIANGDVKIFSSDFVATSDDGYYSPAESLFILENKVIVNNGDSIATGEKFIYDLQTRKGNFVGKSNNIKSRTKEDNRVVVIIGDSAKKQNKTDKTKR